jgi:hypothetical protein
MAAHGVSAALSVRLGTVKPTPLDGRRQMPRYSTIFNFVLIAAFSLANAVAGSPEQPQESEAIVGMKAYPSASEATPGRFAMTPYRETLVLLDTATGNTWLLKASGDAESLSWTPIHRDLDRSLEMLAVAEAATDGRINTQRVPELGVMILKGSREDVDAAKSAIQKKEESGRAAPRK